MVEKDLNSILVHSLRDAGFHTYKIPDSGNAERFSPVKPYDIFAVGNHITFAIEGKLIKPKGSGNFAAFNFNKFEKQQLTSLLDIDRRVNGKGLIALYIWKPRAINRVYFISCTDIENIIESGRYSLAGKEIEKLNLYFDCKKRRFQFPENIESLMHGA